MRIDLPDGQWADLREQISHGADKTIKRARRAALAEEDLIWEWQTTLVRQFLRDWSVRDPEGQPITAADADAVDRAPRTVTDRLFEDCLGLYVGATQPDPPTLAPSDSTPSAA